MGTEKRNFDKEAAAWDENPTRVRLANDVADAVSRHVALRADMEVLDFGCGTGLLTLRLAPLVRSITGVDSSQGMLDVLAAKTAKQNLPNVRTLHLDLDRGDVLPGPCDLIVSCMTLHHIERVDSLLGEFHNTLSPLGHLCIADLDSDDGQFHSDNQGVFHSGFDRHELRRIFAAAGFEEIRDTTAAEVTKPARDGEPRRFTIFLMIGFKKGRG
ncbi:MAG: class I SAM-dependent methyltransferase [Phycisphaerales bacterium]